MGMPITRVLARALGAVLTRVSLRVTRCMLRGTGPQGFNPMAELLRGLMLSPNGSEVVSEQSEQRGHLLFVVDREEPVVQVVKHDPCSSSRHR